MPQWARYDDQGNLTIDWVDNICPRCKHESKGRKGEGPWYCPRCTKEVGRFIELVTVGPTPPSEKNDGSGYEAFKEAERKENQGKDKEELEERKAIQEEQPIAQV
jgi:hypothetical protein